MRVVVIKHDVVVHHDAGHARGVATTQKRAARSDVHDGASSIQFRVLAFVEQGATDVVGGPGEVRQGSIG